MIGGTDGPARMVTLSGGPLATRVRKPMRSLGVAASGLAAQLARLEAIALNIANAETTQGPDGAPYRRKVVQFQEVGFQPLLIGSVNAFEEDVIGGVRVAGVAEDLSEGVLVYAPGHPHANQDGYVLMPNVNLTEEMVDMMEARRLFEANASVFQAIKSMLRRATQL